MGINFPNVKNAVKKIRNTYGMDNSPVSYMNLRESLNRDLEKAMSRRKELDVLYNEALSLNGENRVSNRLSMFSTRSNYEKYTSLLGARLKSVNDYISKLEYLLSSVSETIEIFNRYAPKRISMTNYGGSRK
jgi:hypothetical protein